MIPEVKIDSNQQYPSEKKRKRDAFEEPSPQSASKKRRKFAFIYDRFTSVRGEPKILRITCAICKAWLMDYQKDGPGRLLRCYVDRIYHPRSLNKLNFTKENLKSISPLQCSDCKNTWAIPTIYKRTIPYTEIRPAYQVQTGTIKHKIREK